MSQQRFDRRLGQTTALTLGAIASMIGTILIGEAQAAGDPIAGKKKSAVCQICHGIDGQSKLPEAPNLSGQVELYLVNALTAYKTGARKNDMMSLIVPNLSDEDLLDLAAYYANIEITVTPPK